jgi:beta-xylosidase
MSKLQVSLLLAEARSALSSMTLSLPKSMALLGVLSFALCAKTITLHAETNAANPPKPILDGYRADPDIRVFGDTYYIYPTSDKPNWNTTDFSCWSSKNLIDWKNEGIILDVAHKLSWANIKAWAPTAAMRNGKYYFYFVAGDRIGVATATSPAGPFADALGHPLIDSRTAPFPTYPIDPDVFLDDDRQAYLYYGNNHLAAVKLKTDMISLDGKPVEMTPKDPANPFREGIFVLKRNGFYYFMWSVDDARSENYRVAYGTSKSPFGPIEIPANNVILQRHGLAKGTGHHSVVHVPGTDRWYIVYHRHAIPNGNGYTREVCLNRMEFNSDGTIKPVDPMEAAFSIGSLGEPLHNGMGLPPLNR